MGWYALIEYIVPLESPLSTELIHTNYTKKMRIIASEIVKLNQIDMRGSTHEVDRYSQYQLPPGRVQSTFLLLHQRCCGGKVLLRYFLTEKVTKR